MRIFKPTYKDKTTGETRQVEHYYLRYRGRRYPLHVSDKRAAEAKARDLMATLACGYDPRQQDKARTEQIILLAEEYYEALASTAGERQRSQVRQRIKRIATELGVTTLVELTCDKVQGWLNRLKRSARTKHHYRTSVRAFGVWLEQTGRTPRNPFMGLEKVRGIEADRRLVRRALSAAEFELLVVTTEKSLRRFCRMRGPQRAAL